MRNWEPKRITLLDRIHANTIVTLTNSKVGVDLLFDGLRDFLAYQISDANKRRDDETKQIDTNHQYEIQQLVADTLENHRKQFHKYVKNNKQHGWSCVSNFTRTVSKKVVSELVLNAPYLD